MRKILLLIGLLLSFCCVNAQPSKWGFSFTPAFVQSPAIHYGIQPGVEYRFNDRLSIMTEFAFSAAKEKDPSYSNSKYFRVKPELRYVIRERKWGPDLYAGLQASFSYRKWEDQNGGCYYPSNSVQDSVVNYNKAYIRSPVLTSSLQFGFLYSIGEHFIIDIFGGMGARVIFTDYSGIESSTKELRNRAICKLVPVPDPAHWFNTTVARFHSNIGLRLLYRL